MTAERENQEQAVRGIRAVIAVPSEVLRERCASFSAHPARSEVLKQAKTALKDKAGCSGSADGNWGSKTRDAIKTFQKKEGLPDSLTLLRLLQPFGKPGAAPAN
ncbi:MAG TPA: peptidoglycan-binding domain-containing protein [Plasticicumulans sp.]|nr:peptidoglycan-binding domain-containing protein [Plasticicumulans sp.]